MTSLAWTVCVVFAVCGASIYAEAKEPVFHCCVPKLWSAHARVLRVHTIHGSSPEPEEFWNWMHYDSDNERIANIFTSSNMPHKLRVVLDYKHGTVYEIVDEKECRTVPLHEQFHPLCTPQNVSFVAFALAPKIQPLEGVFANTAYFQQDDVTGHMTVTVGNCALVAESTFRVHGEVGMAENTQYLNQTLTVDSTVFNIPSFCHRQHMETDGTVDYKTLLPMSLKLAQNML